MNAFYYVGSAYCQRTKTNKIQQTPSYRTPKICTDTFPHCLIQKQHMKNNNNHQPSTSQKGQQTPPRPTYPPKRFLDDTTSLTSSTITSREKFARRTDEKSATHRSISRNSRDKTIEVMDISKFYTKMTVKSQENDAPPPRKTIINRTEQQEKPKKRSPTPLPGKIKKKNNKEDDTDEKIQTEIIICQLQKKIQIQEDEKKTLAKSIGILERQIKAKLLRIGQLERNLAESQQRQTIVRKKLGELQSLLNSNQNSLNELDKLKNTIKQNKYDQMEVDNTRLKHENSALRQELQKLIAQTHTFEARLLSSIKETEALRKTNDQMMSWRHIQQKRREVQELHRAMQASKGQKEQAMEQHLHQIGKEKEQIKLKLEKTQLRLIILNRKKNQEVDSVKDSKNQIINKLRKKLSFMSSQNQTLLAQNEQLKEKIRDSRFSGKIPHRKQGFLENNQGQETFRLDLSP